MNFISSRVRWFGMVAAVVAGVVIFESSHVAGETPASVSPAQSLTSLGFKFDGSAGCSASKCHGADTSVDKKNFWGNEFTLWHGRKDPHHTAFRTLVSADGKKIAAALKIASATKSVRCLNCHSTLATGAKGEDLKGRDYTPAEGVSCNACHGPSEKYLEPHSKEGWIDGQRKALDHEKLVKTLGLYDTLPVFERAARCTSCHLTIEPDLVAAGHSQPTFEMNHFSTIYPDRHWHDPAGTFPAQLWASGQLAELHDAMLQVAMHAASNPPAPEELKKAYNQAMSHLAVLTALTTLKSVDVTALNAAVQALSAANAANDSAKIDISATAAAEQCDAPALVAAVSGFNPDAATATTLLIAIAKADYAKLYGPRGEEQQAYAIEALAAAAGNDALTQAVKPMLPTKPGSPPAADDYTKALTDLRAKLPK